MAGIWLNRQDKLNAAVGAQAIQFDKVTSDVEIEALAQLIAQVGEDTVVKFDGLVALGADDVMVMPVVKENIVGCACLLVRRPYRPDLRQ